MLYSSSQQAGQKPVGYMRWKNGGAEYIADKSWETPDDGNWHTICVPQADSQSADDPADIIAVALQTSRRHAIEIMQQAVDADRVARIQTDSQPAPAGGEVAGWQMVPIKPTHDMLCALSGEWHPSRHQPERYAAMLAAAPTPPAQAADSVLEDAARYRWLRRWKGQEHEPPFTVQHEVDGALWGGDLDAAIDAAMNKGGA